MDRKAAARVLAGAAVAVAGAHAYALPSTFGPTIGSALLCRSHLDSASYYAYLAAAFGPSYKHEGGAYWFRTEATLWGQPVREVMVSDGSGGMVFIGAVADTAPDKLAEAVLASAGTAFRAADQSRFPLRVSNPGSTIAYHQDRSKIYCARRKPLPLY